MNMMTSPSTLMAASNNWASRPDDQRFTCLDTMLEFARTQRRASKSLALASTKIEAQPITDDNDIVRGLAIVGQGEVPSVPSHWAFGQLAARIQAPAGYLRRLPADLAADCINDGLQRRAVEDVGALLRQTANGIPDLAALTGPNYGRVWNSDVIEALRQRFGDGITGQFTVPGEFGIALDEVTKANTTLFASDRDMFVFLADEKNRIEMPNRRNGQPGSLARGFFVWNSEVGATTLGIATFLFDYVCCNRIVWGAEGYQEIKVRHSAGAPVKFMRDVAPAIQAYANSSAQGIQDAIVAAQAKKIGGEDEVHEFLTKRRRFTQTQAKAINLAHVAEEGRPIETIWDATVGVTAYAKHLKHQDARIELEREGGKIMNLAA